MSARRAPVVVSRRRPEFAALSDSDVLNEYSMAEAQRRQLTVSADAGLDVTAAQEANHARLFALDDELCARDLELPT